MAAQAVNFGRPIDDQLQRLSGAALRAYVEVCVTARDRFVAEYAWAIPNDAALDALAALGPIVELGAGTGYWAWLLRQRGVDVLAFDIHPPATSRHCNAYHRNRLAVGTCWTEVRHGTPTVLRGEVYADRTLFLCWPPPGTMAARALRWYAGTTVALVGCGPDETGNHALYAALERSWRRSAVLAIPQWADVPDELTIWKRREK